MENTTAAADERRNQSRGDIHLPRADWGTILDLIPGAVAYIDRRGWYRYVNRPYAELICRTPADILGSSVEETLGRPAFGVIEERVASALSGSRQEFDIDVPLIDERRCMRAVYAPDLRNDGEIKGFVAYVLDVTRLRAAELQVQASREQLRALTAHLERVREEERTEVARDLHDEVGQAMTALQMDLSWLRQQDLPSSAVEERLDAMVALTNTAIDAGRRIATRLRPSVLDDLGLEAAVEWMARDFTIRSGIPCRVDVTQSAVSLDRGVLTALFRILQEALTNVIRHAECSSVEIRLDLAGDPLRLVIGDDGRGARDDELDDPRALGVLGMRERAALFGGRVEIEGGAGSGTTVRVTIPFPNVVTAFPS